MTTIEDKLSDIRERSAYQLTGDADCSSPDSNDSAGAAFLVHVRDDLLDRLTGEDDIAAALDAMEYDGTLSEIADNAPSVYISTRWSEFVDLGAYNEDPTELGADGSDMLQSAAVCLYIIADRLVGALIQEIRDYIEENDDEDEDEDESHLGTTDYPSYHE